MIDYIGNLLHLHGIFNFKLSPLNFHTAEILIEEEITEEKVAIIQKFIDRVVQVRFKYIVKKVKI